MIPPNRVFSLEFVLSLVSLEFVSLVSLEFVSLVSLEFVLSLVLG
jgi:hypothetical protein